jgi:predicted permease
LSFFITTLESLAITAAVGGVGYLAAARGLLNRNALKVLAGIALEIALPCQIFAAILRGFNPDTQPHGWLLPLWWVGLTGLQAGVAWISGRWFPPELRREARLGFIYQNAIFIPLVMLSEMFGATSGMVVSLFLFTLFFPVFFFNTAPLFFQSDLRKFRWNHLLTPALIATGAALLLRLANLQDGVPGFCLRGIEMVGAIAVPGLLMYLGGAIYQDRTPANVIRFGPVLRFVLIRNLLLPGLVLLIVLGLRLSRDLGLLLVLQAAMPPITALTALVEREGGNRAFTNQIMLASFLSALITVPLFLALHHWILSGL